MPFIPFGESRPLMRVNYTRIPFFCNDYKLWVVTDHADVRLRKNGPTIELMFPSVPASLFFFLSGLLISVVFIIRLGQMQGASIYGSVIELT